LQYNLYANAGHTQILGDGTAGTVAHGPTALTLTRSDPVQSLQRLVYGRIPGKQDVPPGIYQSVAPIVVTIEY
jgi:spore coat protein U-like protein